MTSSFEARPTPCAERASFVTLPIAAELARFEGVGRDAGAGAAGAAPELVPEPVVDVEAIRAAAYEAGREAGRAECPWQEAEGLRVAIHALDEALHGVAALRRGYLLDQRSALVELACALAERVLGAAVAVRLDAIAGVVERALAVVGEPEAIRLRLAPGDVARIREGLAPELQRLIEAHGVVLESDPALRAGDARVLAGRTRVDARLGETLRQLREEMLELVDLQEEAG